MHIPKEIKVGGIVYDIVFVDPEDLGDNNGETNQQTQVIKINQELTMSMAQKVLWHELAHAWNITWDEDLVEEFATMVSTIVTDNDIYPCKQKRKR